MLLMFTVKKELFCLGAQFAKPKQNSTGLTFILTQGCKPAWRAVNGVR